MMFLGILFQEQKLIEEKNVLEDQLYVTKETLQKTKVCILI